MPTILTRRTFLAGSTASSLVPSMAFAAERADVVIVGGGLSGLYSALLLKDLGYRVIVLEANNRVGGRVHTVQTVDGPVDVGASQIGRGYARVLDVCQRFNLQLIPEDRDLLTFGAHYKDAWIDSKNWANHPLNKCVGEERSIPPLMMGLRMVSKYNPFKESDDWLNPRFANMDISLRELMKRNGHSDQAIELASYSAPGIGIDETSVIRMWQEETRGAIDRRMAPPHTGPKEDRPIGENSDNRLINGLATNNNVVGGCQQIPLAMAAELGDRVRLGKRVGRIAMTNTSAQVTCTDGSSYTARYVISALPFTMLRDVVITGKANPLALRAINTMPYANTARMYITVDKPFWKEDGLAPSFSTDGPLGMFWAIDNHTGEGMHRAMLVMVGKAGRDIAALDSAAAQAMLLQELERIRPASKGLIKPVTYKDWARDPLQKGCGFSLAPGQVNSFARDMTKPWQRLHFAGEHTRRQDFGMESALESGERVAMEIAQRG